MVNSEFDKHNDDNLFPITDITPLESEGATSSVYKVRLNGKWHFLKRPKKEFATHPLYISAFEKEFEVGYTLDHPNIVRYVSKGYDRDGIYLLTEYVDGTTLKDFASSNPAYFRKTKNCTKFLMQVLSALEYLHGRQILHLDLKPENILITHINKDVKLIDLGFAYNDCYQFQSSGKTKDYAAPEQFNNGKIDERTDIYTLGLIILYLFSGSTELKKINKLPRGYRTIARKCLQESSARRYNNIIEIKEKLTPRRHLALVVGVLSIFLLIGGYFIITKHVINTSPINSIDVNETKVPLPLIDSVKHNDVPNDSIENQVRRTKETIQNNSQKEMPLSEADRLSRMISARVKAQFTLLYSTYKEINKDNYMDAQSMYADAVNASFALVDTYKQISTKTSPQEISVMVTNALDKETAHYRTMFMSYCNENAALIESDSIKN